MNHAFVKWEALDWTCKVKVTDRGSWASTTDNVWWPLLPMWAVPSSLLHYCWWRVGGSLMLSNRPIHWRTGKSFLLKWSLNVVFNIWFGSYVYVYIPEGYNAIFWKAIVLLQVFLWFVSLINVVCIFLHRLHSNNSINGVTVLSRLTRGERRKELWQINK